MYAAKNVALNAEASYFKMPESASDEYKGRYMDFDINATYNPHKNVGVQAGYRSIDVFYDVEERQRDLDVQGPLLRRAPCATERRRRDRQRGASGQVT